MDDILQALPQVISAFEDLGIHYYIGGSISSSNYGIPRTTMDIDIIADLNSTHAEPRLLNYFSSNFPSGGNYYVLSSF